MPVTAEESALAELVVAKSKSEARVDTGRLKRSINKKVQRGTIVFREYFYGEYGDNSTLEQNAKRMMGNVPYKIERLNEDGSIAETKTVNSSGRFIPSLIPKKEIPKISGARALINKILNYRRDAKKIDPDKDN